MMVMIIIIMMILIYRLKVRWQQ